MQDIDYGSADHNLDAGINILLEDPGGASLEDLMPIRKIPRSEK